jgi:hypothetical protein
VKIGCKRIDTGANIFNCSALAGARDELAHPEIASMAASRQSKIGMRRNVGIAGAGVNFKALRSRDGMPSSRRANPRATLSRLFPSAVGK